jgi:chemotaxis protein histidine kinase CheA
MAEPKSPQEEARLAAIRAALVELQAEYAAALPGLVNELSRATESACNSGSDKDLRHVQTLAHRMHGAAGSYGFAPVSAAAAKMEELLAARQETLAPFDDELCSQLRSALEHLQDAAHGELDRLAGEQQRGA